MGERKRGNWSVHELERLRALYPRVPEERLARMLRRSLASVQRRAREMFAREQRGGPWTASEDGVLREAFGVLTLRRMSLVLARPAADIRKRAAALRAQRRSGAWSASEEARLKRLYGSRRDADLEVCLSRSRRDIAATAERLCLSKDKGFLAGASPAGRSPVASSPAADGAARGSAKVRVMPRWSLQETALLRELYTDHDNLDVARRLGRTVTSVANKASQLGLRKSPSVLRRVGRRNVAVRHERDRGTGVDVFDGNPTGGPWADRSAVIDD